MNKLEPSDVCDGAELTLYSHTTPATNKRKRKTETRSAESEALTALQTKMQQIESALRSQGLSQILDPPGENAVPSPTDSRKRRLNSIDANAVSTLFVLYTQPGCAHVSLPAALCRTIR